jgi:hypothetical protein
MENIEEFLERRKKKDIILINKYINLRKLSYEEMNEILNGNSNLYNLNPSVISNMLQKIRRKIDMKYRNSNVEYNEILSEYIDDLEKNGNDAIEKEYINDLKNQGICYI